MKKTNIQPALPWTETKQNTYYTGHIVSEVKMKDLFR